MENVRCAIYGAGSLGTVLGALMTKGGANVELINRNKAHIEALKENGATITGTIELNIPVTANTPDEMSGQYDVILLMTKQLMNREVVTFLNPYLSENGVIVTLQNGLPEPLIAEFHLKKWMNKKCDPTNTALLCSPELKAKYIGITRVKKDEGQPAEAESAS